MKLLFDQNISFRIINKISAIFPSSKQVRELGLEDSSDKTIWNFAKENRFSIVTFDADFADIASVKDSPPKIIWLRTGNMTTENIAKLLNEHQVIIKKFHKNSEYQKIACLEIL